MTLSIFTEQYAKFRELLIQYRQRISFTQAQLAQALNRPQSFVSKYESGERRLDIIEFLEIAEILQFDPCELLKRVNDDTLATQTIMDEWEVTANELTILLEENPALAVLLWWKLK